MTDLVTQDREQGRSAPTSSEVIARPAVAATARTVAGALDPDGYEAFRLWKAEQGSPVSSVEVPCGGVAFWHEPVVRLARDCPENPDGDGHQTSGGWPGRCKPVAGPGAGLTAVAGGGMVRVQDDDWSMGAVEVHRCRWCKALLVAVGAPLTEGTSCRWYEIADQDQPAVTEALLEDDDIAERLFTDGEGRPVWADRRISDLLARVDATYRRSVERAADGPSTNGHGPVCPPELRARLADAAAEVLQLMPAIARLTAVYAQAEAIAFEAFPAEGGIELDRAFDRFFAESGAQALGDAMRDLVNAMTTPSGTWVPQ